MNKIMKINIVFDYLKKILNKESKKKFLMVLILSIASSMAVIITPVIISKITYFLQAKSDQVTNLIFLLGLIYVVVISAQKIISFLSVYLQSLLRIQCISCLSEDYLYRLYMKSSSSSDMTNSGDMSQRLNQASNDIYIMISNLALSLIPPVIQLLIAIFVIVNSGDLFVSLMFSGYALLFVIVNYFFVKKMLSAREKLLNSGRNTYMLLVDSVQNIPVVRNFNSFGFFFTRFKKVLSDDIDVQKDYWKLDFKNVASTSFLQMLFFSMSFVYTLYNVLFGDKTLAHFILISSYLLVITAPLENLASSFISFCQSFSSFKSFVSYMDSNKLYTTQAVDDLSSCKGIISLNNVTVRYNDASADSLGLISVDFRDGAFITITGRSGAGKSTLIKLLTRQLTPYTGTYQIGNNDAFSISDERFYRSLAYVSQEEFVFMDTVAFNLEIASPGVSREEMLCALEMADFTLPDVSPNDILDKRLSNEGGNLSGGQRQRLSLARLFLRNPSIIVLDEITSSLDVPSELNLLTRIREKFPNATIINVSHRPSAFSFSDDIVIIENGVIADHGTYDEIKNRNNYLLSILNKESVTDC
jgi:ATP-binding cassette, subfamily B, bacterial